MNGPTPLNPSAEDTSGAPASCTLGAPSSPRRASRSSWQFVTPAGSPYCRTHSARPIRISARIRFTASSCAADRPRTFAKPSSGDSPIGRRPPRWRVSLGVDFVALETSSYDSAERFSRPLAYRRFRGRGGIRSPRRPAASGCATSTDSPTRRSIRIGDLIRPDILGIVRISREPAPRPERISHPSDDRGAIPGPGRRPPSRDAGGCCPRT